MRHAGRVLRSELRVGGGVRGRVVGGGQESVVTKTCSLLGKMHAGSVILLLGSGSPSEVWVADVQHAMNGAARKGVETMTLRGALVAG